jgi:hypothetical protein
MERENHAITQEQKIQQKLERELADLDIQIGSIFDDREERKRK